MGDALRAALLRHPYRYTALAVGLAAAVGFLMASGAFTLRDQAAGHALDIVRWERTSIWGKWLFHAGAPLRHDPDHDEAIREYFLIADPASPEAQQLENVVERAIEGRIDAVLTELGITARLRLPGSVFPPVAIELTRPPNVLVQSPRGEIRRERVDLLRPNLDTETLLRIECGAEAAQPELSTIVMGSGGVATYPAMVLPSRTYRGTVETAAHEWMHHYLSFYPLGLNYFSSAAATTINETVADLVGREIATLVIDRFGDPTLPAPLPTPEPEFSPAPPSDPLPPPEPPAYFAILHELRLGVGELLAAERIEEAEQLMDAVRDELEARGFYFRRINQAFFAWTGTYAARPDAVDPLGAQIREVRDRTDSLPVFLSVIRNVTSRADVEVLATGTEE